MSEIINIDLTIICNDEDTDYQVSRDLVRKIKSFKAPQNISLEKRRLNDIAIVREHNNTDEEIETILEQSEWFVLVCSAVTRESAWIKNILKKIGELHKDGNILVALSRGEPKDSFPEEIYYQDGVRVEPLAANCRGNTRKERINNIDMEYLKLLSTIMGVRYDDLVQRHRTRKLKTIRLIISAVMGLLLIFAAYSGYAAVNISRQNDTIEYQVEKLKIDQAKALAQRSLEAAGDCDKREAVQVAYEALTEYQGNVMPVTDEARYALFQALNPYAIGWQNGAGDIISFDDKVVACWRSQDGGCFVVYDALGKLTGFNQENEFEQCFEINDITINFNTDIRGERVSDTGAIVDGRVFAYVCDDGIACVDINNGEQQIFHGYKARALYADSNYLYALCDDGLHQINIDEGNKGSKKIELRGVVRDSNMVFDYPYLVYATDDDILYVHNIDEDIWADCEWDALRFLEGCISTENDDIAFYYSQYRNAEDDLFFHTSGFGRYFISEEGLESQWSRTCWQPIKSATVRNDESNPETKGYVVDIILQNMTMTRNYDDGSVIENVKYKNNIASWSQGIGLFTDGSVSLPGDSKVILEEWFELGELELSTEIEPVLYGMDGSVFTADLQKLIPFKLIQGRDVVDIEDDSCAEYSTDTINDYAVNIGKLTTGYEAVEEAKRLGIENAGPVTSVLHAPDESFYILSFTDGWARTYDADTFALQDEWQMMDPVDEQNNNIYIKNEGENIHAEQFQYGINTFLGTDAEGNSYLRGYHYGYILSPDYKCIGVVHYLYGYDSDAERVIISFSKYAQASGTVYVAPVYKIEDLIAMAKEYLDEEP